MIEIRLKLQIGIYMDYLAYLFPLDADTGHYKVTAASDLGRLVIAYAMRSDTPKPEKPAGDNERYLTLDLPDCDSTQHLKNRWLYIQAGDEARIFGALKSIFNMDLINYYQRGWGMGYQKKELIEMFAVSRGLMTVDPYEALHKRVYRLEQQKMARVSQILLNKVKYFEQTIDKSGKP